MQEVIKAKKVAKKIWDASRRQEGKDRYRQANKAAKKAWMLISQKYSNAM